MGYASAFRMAMESVSAEDGVKITNTEDEGVEVGVVKSLEDEIEILHLAKETDEIAEDGRLLNDMIWATQEVGEFREQLAVAQESGGLTKEAARAYRWGLESFARRHDLQGIAPTIAVESFSGSIGNRADETFALEAEAEGFLSKMWKSIKEFFSNMWKKIKGWFGGSKEKAEKSLDKVAAKLEELKDRNDGEVTLKYTKESVNKAAVDATVSAVNDIITKLNPSNSGNAFSSIEGFIGSADKVKEEFGKLLAKSKEDLEKLKESDTPEIAKKIASGIGSLSGFSALSGNGELAKAVKANEETGYVSPLLLGAVKILFTVNNKSALVKGSVEEADGKGAKDPSELEAKLNIAEYKGLLETCEKNKSKLIGFYDLFNQYSSSISEDFIKTEVDILENKDDAKKDLVPLAKAILTNRVRTLANISTVYAGGPILSYLGKLPGFINSIAEAKTEKAA